MVTLDAHAAVGEGPIWDAEHAELIWVDIPGERVNWLQLRSGQDESVNVGQPVGAVALRTNGGLVLAVRDGFALLDRKEAEPRLICETDDPGIRMNDVKCDSTGRCWAGTMASDLTPGVGALYRLETDFRVDKVLDDVTISNGLAWSPDDRTMYFIDSRSNGVDAFDYDAGSGAIVRRRRVVDVPPASGVPDGMTIDAEGFLCVALWGGWAVHRYTPDGTLDGIVELPIANVTSCAFGGAQLDELYVTSATVGLSPEELG